MCYNFKKLAGSFSLTLIALISYLFLNAENLIFKGKIWQIGKIWAGRALRV
ncbi:hypothetical protein IO355_001548 [Campylobacter upsaliensis]|nr:hypothetical protein [Campylobacter upsaliensis]EIW4615423.1 hypothetical protein [Campylobacter upsaliensis]EKB9601395.1 hypothetical protein [Campylobacter upsaliensis]